MLNNLRQCSPVSRHKSSSAKLLPCISKQNTMSAQDFQIPSWINEEYLLKVLQHKFPSNKDLQVQKVTVSVGINKGDGFVSELFRVVVDSSLGTFPLLLKKPQEVVEIFELLQPLDMYNREITFYLEYYPAMKEILESVGEFEEFAPEMFYAEEEADILILRDLRSAGYKTGDRIQRVSTEAAEVVLRKLAKFHAASLVLNKKWSGKVEQRKIKLFEGDLSLLFRTHLRALVEDMRTWGSDYEHIIPKLADAEINYKTLCLQNVTSDRGLDLLIHADPWFTNLLIRNGDTLDVVIIDFQTAAWGSLAIDLIYFTITSLNEKDFEQREELLKVYHGHLERVLQKLQWERKISYKDVLREYKDKFLHAMYSMVAKVLTAVDPEEQSLDIIANEEGNEVMKKIRNPRINKELRCLVKLMEEYGVFDRKVVENGMD